MLAALTGAGLSAAAGLNAYIPFLLVALIARFTEVIELPHQYAWIESNWAIGIAAVLLLNVPMHALHYRVGQLQKLRKPLRYGRCAAWRRQQHQPR